MPAKSSPTWTMPVGIGQLPNSLGLAVEVNRTKKQAQVMCLGLLLFC